MLTIKKEKERFESDFHSKCKEAADYHREILVHKETIRRHETTIKEKSEEVHTLSERVERVQSECDSYRSRCDDFEAEATSLQALIVSIRLELSTAKSEHEHTLRKLQECETRYEEICHTYEEYQEGSSGFEFQITKLRGLLREVREEKERAIASRVAADQERDQALARLESKSREYQVSYPINLRLSETLLTVLLFVQELEEYYAHVQSGRRSGGRTIRRSFKSTTIGENDEFCGEID